MGDYSNEIMVGKGITKLEGRCGGSACVKGTRMAVWFLVSIMDKGLGSWSNKEVLYNYPHLKQSDLNNVIKYWKSHIEEISQEIKEDEVEDEIRIKKGCEENHQKIQKMINDRGAVKIDITKPVYTRSGKRVIGLQYNSVGDLAGSIVVKKNKTKYVGWDEKGIRDPVWGRFESEDLVNKE